MVTARKTGALRVIRGVQDDAPQDGKSDRAAEFERLYRDSYEMVFGLVMFRMCDEEAARDVVAEAFLRAARSFDQFDSKKAKFSTWVCSIARNCSIDYFRRQKNHASVDDISESVLAIDANVSEHVANADLARRLLAVLDDEDREIVFMKFCEGWSNAEIAREMDMNPSTVATRVQRALDKMRSASDI